MAQNILPENTRFSDMEQTIDKIPSHRLDLLILSVLTKQFRSQFLKMTTG